MSESRDRAPDDGAAEARAVSDYLRFLSAPLENHVRRELARERRRLGRPFRLGRGLLRWFRAGGVSA